MCKKRETSVWNVHKNKSSWICDSFLMLSTETMHNVVLKTGPDVYRTKPTSVILFPFNLCAFFIFLTYYIMSTMILLLCLQNVCRLKIDSFLQSLNKFFSILCIKVKTNKENVDHLSSVFSWYKIYIKRFPYFFSSFFCSI